MKTFFLGMLLCILAGCAAEIPRQPATLTPPADTSGPGSIVQVDEHAVVRLASGYSRTIVAGSKWAQVGTVEGHAVYKSMRNVFTIEGSHVHEAYLLLKGDTLAGFYLPGENAVSWLKQPVVLKYH